MRESGYDSFFSLILYETLENQSDTFRELFTSHCWEVQKPMREEGASAPCPVPFWENSAGFDSSLSRQMYAAVRALLQLIQYSRHCCNNIKNISCNDDTCHLGIASKDLPENDPHFVTTQADKPKVLWSSSLCDLIRGHFFSPLWFPFIINSSH